MSKSLKAGVIGAGSFGGHHARKYAAKLESLLMPFLYYENVAGGHSAAADLRERARRLALEFVYLSQRLID